MKASDYIAEFLALQGVTAVFEMTGGMITHLLDSIGARDDIDVVSVHHEQSAAFAAEGVARMTGVPGVALATSGPGATNLITGIGSCYFDSVPAVFITGQVNTHELAGASGVRQAGFQETDIVSIVRPITKDAWRVESADELPSVLAIAFQTSLAGRPGPVLIDIPMDVQRADIDTAPALVEAPARVAPGEEEIARVIEAIQNAERPIALVGGGVRAAGATDSLLRLVESAQLPVVASLMGLDAVPHDSEFYVGLIGTYGNRWANLALRDADVVLVLGARLDVRQTGADVEAFAAGKTIIRVDVDPAQLDWRVPTAVSVMADLGEFCEAALEALSGEATPDRGAWLTQLQEHVGAWPLEVETADASGINPAEVMRALSERATHAAAYSLDVGQNQMWAAQGLQLGANQRVLTSGGMGAMGFAVPTAIGAALTLADGDYVIAIAGDGGVQVNIQELETLVRLGLPVRILIVNNGCLGMVRQFQAEYFESRYQSTVWGYGAPDFVAVSEAYGIPARRVTRADEIADGCAWLTGEHAGPALLEVVLDTETCVRPKVSFGSPVYTMDDPPAATS